MSRNSGRAYLDTTKSEMLLVETVVNAAREVKGSNIVIFETANNSCLADYAVVISGRSDRQVQGIANRIIDCAKQMPNTTPLGIEGLDEGKWALLDFGSVIIHVFYEDTRKHFHIEELWNNSRRFLVGDDLKEPFQFQLRRAA